VTLIKEAFSHAMEVDANMKQLRLTDFHAAFDKVKPETSAADVKFYEEYARSRLIQ